MSEVLFAAPARARAFGHGLAAALLLATASLACSASHRTPREVVNPAGASDRGSVTDGGTYYVVYEPSPDPIPFNRVFELAVEVHDAEGRTPSAPVREVIVRATMPGHGHGMNLVPQVRRTAPGRFGVQGMLFHMEGLWRLEIEVREGENAERALFDVVLT